ncbi:MAG: metallophosphoesterase [Thermoleophilaceae bacterium]|nr:metallophosphoesterase [Thermoleophilaceae bacterium]
MRTLRPSSRPLALCIALLALAAVAGSVTAARGGLDRTPPKVSVTKPAAGAETTDTTPRLSGRAGRASGDRRLVSVRVYVGRRAKGRAQRLLTARRSAGGGWSLEVRPALLPGTYTAVARQLDARGNRGVSRARSFTVKAVKTVRPPVTGTAPPPVAKPKPKPPPVVVPPPAASPTVTITAPVGGTETADTTPAFAASAGASEGQPEAVSVDVYSGGSPAGTPVQTVALEKSGVSWTGEPAEELDDGVYSARATVTAAGRTGTSAAVAFRVDTAPPAPVLSVPASGSSTSDGTPLFSGSAGNAAGDATQVRVLVFAGLSDTGTPLATASGPRSGAAFAVSAATALPVGTYTARAEQQDGAGNTGRSAPVTFAVTSTAAAATYRDAVMADAPRAYWRLGEPSGTSAADQTAFADTGTYQGSPALGQAGIVPVAQSTAVTLDGSDDSVRVPSAAALSPTAALSLEAWLRPSAMPSSTATLMRKDGQYMVRISSSGAVSFRLWRNGTTSEVATPSGAVSVGLWSHVAATYDGTSMAVYVNGTVRATLAVAGAVDSGSSQLMLGTSGSGDWFRGRMDEVAVYGAALPGPRVLAHYAKSSPVEDPPPTVVLESPAPGSTTDLRPVFAGTANGETATVTVKVYAGPSASGTPVQTLTAAHQSSNLFSVAASSNLSAGSYTAQAEQATFAGLVGKSAPVGFTTQAPSGETATIAAAGDIADCGGTDDEATANLLDAIPGTVMTLGDNAYQSGTASNYACYNSSWGRHKARTRPIPGDHDYGVPDAGGYFDYFGAAAGPRPSGFYSYDLGAWHVVAVNTGCYVQLRSCNAATDEWLENDLEQNDSQCTLAQIHEPRFSSGEVHGDVGSVEPLWEILYDHGADVVLSGSEHMYERFGPQTPDGGADAARGIRQFTVGTGGESHYQVGDIQPNSQVRESNTFGVLRMTLRPGAYDWQFVPVAGRTFTDSGTGSCH